MIERFLHRMLRVVSALPAPVQRVLGGGSVEHDGETLHPELLVLRRIASRPDPKWPKPPVAMRKEQSAVTRIVGGRIRRHRDIVTRDLSIPGPGSSLRARLFSRAGLEGAPLLVFFHGGGYVFGDVDSHDAPCRILCRDARMKVLSVEYRLAPEHPFPAGLDDARAALRWAQDNARSLGADPARVAVGGDSAGGNLSACVALMAAHDGGPAPIAQLLIYPAIDRQVAWKSIDSFGDGFFLRRAAIEWYYEQYASAAHRKERNPRIHPIHAEDLSGLAPALVVTAGFDPLRDEGEAYVKALEAAGNRVVLRRFGGLVHGFINMVGISPACRNATREIATAFAALVP